MPRQGQILPVRKTFGSVRAQTSDEVTAPKQMDDMWLAKANEAYQASTTFLDTNYRKDWEASIAHFQNRHVPGSKYLTDAYRFRSKHFRPKTRSIVRQNEAATAAAFFSQIDVIHYDAADDHDPIQLGSAALRRELLNYRLTGHKQIPWFQVCIGAMQEANVYGIVGSKQDWEYREKSVEAPLIDPNSGEPILDEQGKPATTKTKRKIKDQPNVKLIPIENIRFDPAADWTDVVNTSPYFIVMFPERIGEIKRRMRTGEFMQVSDDVLKAARNMAIDPTRAARQNNREEETDPRFSKNLTDFDIVWIHEVFLEQEDEDWHFYTVGELARLTKPRRIQQVYLHGIRPYVVGTCMIEPHRAVPDSPVHIGKGLQKEANVVGNTRLDNVLLALNKRFLVRRGKQVDLQSLVRNAPGSVTLVNDIERDVFPMEFNDVTRSAYEEQNRINVDYDELMGSFSTGSVQSNRQLGETVGGLAMLRGTANSMTQYLIRVFSETWVERVLNQLDALEQHYESDMELLTLMARRANIMRYGIDRIDESLLLAPARISVNVAGSAMDPVVRLEITTFAMQKYAELAQSLPPDIDREKVKGYLFGLLGLRDASQFSLDTDENPQLVAAMQQIQQLKAMLEAKTEPARIKAENDQRLKAAEIRHEEQQNERDRQLQAMLAKMADDTKRLIAGINANAQADRSAMGEETKRLVAALQSDTKQVLATMAAKPEPQPTTVIDSAIKGELGEMAKAFQQIAQSTAQNGQMIAAVIQQLQQNSQALADMANLLGEPRENEIVERDDEGFPTRTRSRIVRTTQ